MPEHIHPRRRRKCLLQSLTIETSKNKVISANSKNQVHVSRHFRLELEEEEIVLLGVSHVVHDVLQQIDLALVAAVLALCHDLQQQRALRDYL